MAQPLSEHDEDFGSLDDFAPEQPAVQARHADFAPEQLAVDFAPELSMLPGMLGAATEVR